MASDKNLLKPFVGWSKENGTGTTDMDSFVVSEDGLTATFTITHESSYIYNNVDTSTIKGHTLKITFDSFSSTDGLAWFQIRLYNADNSDYTKIDKKQQDADFLPNSPFELSFEVPGDCGRVRICVRHEYDNDGINPPATLSIANIKLVDTYSESLTALNFHKVLEENLPATVTPGSQHIYFTTDGTTVKQFISTKEGYLVPVGATDSGSGSSGTAEYYNAYTQQYIDERKQEILDLQNAGRCITFAVATDIHIQIEDGDAGRYNQVRDFLMVSDQLALDYICCCGDIMSYCQEWDGFKEPRIEKVQQIFNQAKVPWFATRGNHDYNSDDYNPSNNDNIKPFNLETMDKYLTTRRIWHRSITSRLKQFPNIDIVFDEDRPDYGYFYVDDYALKHRLVFCNSEETHETEFGRGYINGTDVDCIIAGVSTKHQITWLVNKAMDMTGKEDWVVSFYTHTAPYTDLGEPDPLEFHGYGWNDPELRNIVKHFQEGTRLTTTYGCCDVDTHEWVSIPLDKDFSKQGPIDIIGWFGGHIHDDCHKQVDGLNVIVSTCTCGSWRTSWRQDPNGTKVGPERNKSNLAMSINVFVINLNTKTINCVKLGSKRDNAVKTSSDFTMKY